MNQKDLHTAIEMIVKKLRELQYPINDTRELEYRTLEYNKATQEWDTYYIDERGGFHDLQTFSSEEEACSYILDNAISFFRTVINSDMDAIRHMYIEKES